MTEKKYSWKRTAWKGFKTLVYVFVAGLAAKYGGSNWYLALAPVLTAVENYWKNS